MIQPNELRIGNWVIFNDNTDRFGSVIGLNSYDTVHLACNYVPDHKECAIKNTALHCDFIDPIPLTPEILEKAGFEPLWPGKNDSFYKGDFKFRFPKYGAGLIVRKYNGGPFCCVHSLHQLQNLYFALTGEELQIEL